MTDIHKTIDDLTLLNKLCHGTVLDDAIELLKERDTVEHALNVLRENGWEEETSEDHGLYQHRLKMPCIVQCKDCRYATRHCSDSVFGKPLYDCGHPRQIGREGVACHSEDWYCADGVRKDG